MAPFAKLVAAKNAEALHLRVGSHPMLAIGGRELPITASPTLTREVWRKLVFSLLTSEQIELLASQKQLEVPIEFKEVGLFRAVVAMQGERYDLSIYQANGTAPAAPAPPAPAPEAPPVASAVEPKPATQGTESPAGALPPPPRQEGSPPLDPALKSPNEQSPTLQRTPAPERELDSLRSSGGPGANFAPGGGPGGWPPAGLSPVPPVPAAPAPPPAPSSAAASPIAPPPATEPPPAPSSAAASPVAPPPATEPPPEPEVEEPEPEPEAAPVHVPGLPPGVVLGPPVPATHPYRPGEVTLDELLSILLDKGGSDLHLHVGKRPLIRVDGKLIIAHEGSLDEYSVMAMIETCTSAEERALLFARNDLDTSYNLKSLSRFRVNVLNDTRGFAMVLRVIPFKIPDWHDLGVPEAARNLIYRPHGLFLVTGPTGSGKSTTLASLIHDVNQTQYKHIITIEDPIEFVHNDAKCCITQREVGVDTRSFADGVVDVLRQDPDLILVGEMRDLDTMANALLAAESGRLVLATLHTTSASQTVERIINVFPEEHQNVARSQLANCLVGILSQTLLVKKGGGRIAGFELMVATESIRNLIKENKPQMIQTAIETGARYGMKSLDQYLLELVEGGLVSFEDAYSKCQNTKNFKALEAKLKGVPVSALAED